MQPTELHFARGVDLRNMSPQSLLAWHAAASVCAGMDVPCVVSSVFRPGNLSKHGKGDAIDVGMRGIPLDVGDLIHAKLEVWLGRTGGGQYDVVNELRPGTSANWTGPHIHIEFDPKEK